MPSSRTVPVVYCRPWVGVDPREHDSARNATNRTAKRPVAPMFPMAFDPRILDTLPLPGRDRIQQVSQLIRSIMVRRVFGYFRQRRGTEAAQLNTLSETLSIVRFEDEQVVSRLVCLPVRTDSGWALQIHERVFDFLAFVMPGDPDARLGDGTAEERKMLAFFELLLRHEVEHMLYPDHAERDVVEADVAFALEQRSADPTFYRALRQFLADEMNGINGDAYLALFDAAERERSTREGISRVLRQCWKALSDLPEAVLSPVFLHQDSEGQAGVLRACHRASHAASASLARSTQSFGKFLLLYARLEQRDAYKARTLFKALLEDPGGVSLCRDLDLPRPDDGAVFSESLFTAFRDAVRAMVQDVRARGPELMPAAAPKPAPAPPEEGLKSLKDRIDEVHADPRFPPQVLAVIDKNRLNTFGHSGSKYSELIETLLAIPWGRIEPIRVAPEVFEEGLNRTHYGLQRPKELLCDFFTNLIWRYQLFSPEQGTAWHQTGSAFLLVGPPGVGKTSLAISVAQNLGVPYHKISLGGMRDETDIRGHGFTYEGSKPGAIVQGLIKMGAMNGLFILDEADKTEKFAIATLLEILDPEQNHLFHDKYTETTVDIDLSNCHFFLTANTLETVPAVVVNRCEVVQLDRYSVEEKIAIAREHLIRRVRHKHQIDPGQIRFDPETEEDILRYLVRDYTYEAGVRELERLIRTLFLRIQRKEILTGGAAGGGGIVIRRETVKRYLKEPTRPRQIGEDDRIGETIALGVDVERGVGSIIPIQATAVGAERALSPAGKGYLSIVHATGNIEKIMDESRKVATTGIYHCAGELGIDQRPMEEPVHLHFMGASTRKDGPSAGGAIALALASLASGRRVRRDVAMTGEIDTKGRITAVGGLAAKLEAASGAGCRTVIIPRENLSGEDGIERFPDALKAELQTLTFEDWQGPHEPFDYARHLLQVVAVDHVVQAARVAFIDENALSALERGFEDHARRTLEHLRQPSAACACLQVIQVKTLEELDPVFFEPAFWRACPGLTLLVQPEIEAPARERLQGVVSEPHERMRPFDPCSENLSDVTRALVAAHGDGRSVPIRFSLIAPYYFIKRDGITEDLFPPRDGFEGVTLFANNYSVQGLKIKGCKRILNRVFSLMARSSPGIPGTCPFVGRREGIHVADLGFIPEPYRLDIRRAEKILSRDLEIWVKIVEGAS